MNGLNGVVNFIKKGKVQDSVFIKTTEVKCIYFLLPELVAHTLFPKAKLRQRARVPIQLSGIPQKYVPYQSYNLVLSIFSSTPDTGTVIPGSTRKKGSQEGLLQLLLLGVGDGRRGSRYRISF